MRTAVGTLEKTVFDCPEPRELAEFYAAVLGMQVNEDEPDWVVIGRGPGLRELAFQRSDKKGPQQLHLDIRVDDVDAAQQVVESLGATLLDDTPGRGFRVFADPAGHPFCLVF